MTSLIVFCTSPSLRIEVDGVLGEVQQRFDDVRVAVDGVEGRFVHVRRAFCQVANLLDDVRGEFYWRWTYLMTLAPLFIRL